MNVSWRYSFFMQHPQNKKPSENLWQLKLAGIVETSKINTISDEKHQRTIKPPLCHALTYMYPFGYHFELAQLKFHTPTFSSFSFSLPPPSSTAGTDQGLIKSPPRNIPDCLMFKEGGSHGAILLQRHFWSSAGPDMHLRNLVIPKKTLKSKQLLWTQAFYAIPPI